MPRTDKVLEQLLMDIDCLFMYETLEDHKIKPDQVFELDRDDIKTMGLPLGDLKRFMNSIPTKNDRKAKVIMAGNNVFSLIQGAIRYIFCVS